jgi:Transposase IS116/IS110/IS902 family
LTSLRGGSRVADNAKIIDMSSVLRAKIFCEDLPSADLLDRPLTVEAEFAAGVWSGYHVHPHQVTRLREIPGIGLVTATALVGTVGHIHGFRRARQFASWLGLTPRGYSSGAPRRLGGISKRGDVYLRCLLTHGTRAMLHAAHRRTTAHEPLPRLHQWALTVQARRGHNKATIAVANKLGRIVWAVWTRDVAFDPRPTCPEAA